MFMPARSGVWQQIARACAAGRIPAHHIGDWLLPARSVSSYTGAGVQGRRAGIITKGAACMPGSVPIRVRGGHDKPRRKPLTMRLLRAFTPAREEIAQHRDFLVRAVEVAGDAGIEIGGARKYFLFSAVRSSKTGNFPHLGYPAVRFREHVRDAPREAGEQVAWLAESSLYNASETPARCAARIIEQLMAVIPLVIPA